MYWWKTPENISPRISTATLKDVNPRVPDQLSGDVNGNWYPDEGLHDIVEENKQLKDSLEEVTLSYIWFSLNICISYLSRNKFFLQLYNLSLSIPLSGRYTGTRAEYVDQLTVVSLKVDNRSRKSNSEPYDCEAGRRSISRARTPHLYISYTLHVLINHCLYQTKGHYKLNQELH